MRRMAWIGAGMIAVVVVACGDGESPSEDAAPAATCEYMGVTHALGDRFPAGDGCNGCACTEVSGMPSVQCTAVLCCAMSDTCDATTACNGICCGTGEVCLAGECRCGAGPACGDGDACVARDGGDCGDTCCGASAPCPQ